MSKPRALTKQQESELYSLILQGYNQAEILAQFGLASHRVAVYVERVSTANPGFDYVKARNERREMLIEKLMPTIDRLNALGIPRREMLEMIDGDVSHELFWAASKRVKSPRVKRARRAPKAVERVTPLKSAWDLAVSGAWV